MRACMILTAMAALAMVPLSACGSSAEKASSEGLASNSLAHAIKSDERLSVLAGALESTQLSAVFDGPAEYTVLAPSDQAFDKLGDAKSELTKPENKAALAALLRDHVLPGAVTSEDIEKSLTSAKGEPISMTTLGNGSVTFMKDGDKIAVTSSAGKKALVDGSSLRTRNGVLVPIDTVLK